MSEPLILIIEDDETISLSLRTFFKGRGCGVITAVNGDDGLALALRELPDIVILDLRLPDCHGFEVLQGIKKDYPEISVIVMTGYGEISDAVKAMKLGAEYYFQKPIDLEELAVIVEKGVGLRRMRQGVGLLRGSPYPLVGRSPHIQGLIHMISLLASNASTTVLIRGDTGTGKEIVARNIHVLSVRRDKPFVEINCAAIPEQILESELFGYEVGAFTDAKKTKKGLVELADGGTLFLDEIGDMPPGAQAKVLRVLESRTLKRLGGTRDIPVDVRVIAATNRDLGELIRQGIFREDLYYRLNVMPLSLLPLRERPEDIPLIAGHYLEEMKKAMGKKQVSGFSLEAADALNSYAWPGNVRELRNVIERSLILCQEETIGLAHLHLPVVAELKREALSLGEVEEAHIRRVLDLAGGNRTKAAQMLGLARSTLNEKLKQYNR